MRQRDSEPDWIIAKEAPGFLSRPKATVYKWVDQGKVRSHRPLHEMWLFVPDLRRVDAETPRRRRKDGHAGEKST